MAQLLTLLLAGEASDMKQRLRTALISYILGAFAIMMALLFFVVAAYVAAAFRWGAVQAAIGFAIGFLLLGLVVLGAYKIKVEARKREQQRRRAANATMAASASAMTMLPAMLGKKGIGANVALLVLAGVGGYAAYRHFEQRRKNGG